MQNHIRNRLLSALPDEGFCRLQPKMELVSLSRRQVLQHRNLPMQHAYLIESGAASLLSRTRQDGAVEVAIVGRMGLVGLPVVLGTMRSPHRCIVQVPGEAWRIKADDLQEAMVGSSALRQVLFNYVQAAMVQTAQLVLCNARHSLEQRLARCILMTHDRVEEDDLPLTHDLLSKMLGVRRSGVTETAGRLEAAGLIEKSRGSVRVLDRAGLERVACECYRVISTEYDRLIPPLEKAAALPYPQDAVAAAVSRARASNTTLRLQETAQDIAKAHGCAHLMSVIADALLREGIYQRATLEINHRAVHPPRSLN